MKKKTQGTITSIFGVIFLIIATVMIATKMFFGYNFTIMEIITILGIGYVFLRADDELIKKILFRNDKTS